MEQFQHNVITFCSFLIWILHRSTGLQLLNSVKQKSSESNAEGKITHLGLISRNEVTNLPLNFSLILIHIPFPLDVSVQIFAVFWRKGSNIAPTSEWDVQ